jgi:hypothetical protein
VPNAEVVRRYAEDEGRNPDSRPSGTPRKIDALAFSDARRQDWQTSAVAVDLSQDGIVGTNASEKQAKELFRLTAAPTNLIGSLAQKRVDVWFNCHDGIVGRESVELAIDPLKSIFRSHRTSVQRDRLAHLREGQRHLFDGQLYARRDELASFLQRGVSKAAWVAGTGDVPWGTTKAKIEARREAFSRVALAMLAARILEDKGALGKDRPQSTDSRQLLADARAKWDSFFDEAITEELLELDDWFGKEQVNLMLTCLLSHLTGPVNFALVTHEMIGDLYERALVAERSWRGESLVDLKGVHYTPHAITKRILDRLPLERLPVKDRTVCDLACGSGSFLLAATERLEALFHPREPGADSLGQDWLRRAVMGNDLDPVAILVTKLSYLVAYWNHVDDAANVPYPSLNERGDALTLAPVTAFGHLPSVIVGNPPFDGPEPASAFLCRALDLLLNKESEYPRYLGMVMPAAFIKGMQNKNESVRNRLLQHARILEIWEIPEHAIGLCAQTPTCVILAEITDGTPDAEQELRVSQTLSRRGDAVSALRDSGVTTWSYVGSLRLGRPDDGTNLEDALAFSIIDDIWNELTIRNSTASSLVQVVWGFMHTRKPGYPDPVFSEFPGDGVVPYLRQQRALHPYTVTEQDWKASHDNGLMYWERGSGPGACVAYWPNYESPKIVITAQSNRNASSQLVAALEFAKYYPGKHFQVVTLIEGWQSSFRRAFPKSTHNISSEDILRWFCAILNSPVGHAWFVKNAGPRGPQADVCLTMPLPQIYEPAIAAAVERIQLMARPRNITEVATWDPEAGIVSPAGDLFREQADAAKETNEFWEAVHALNNLVLKSYGLDRRSRDRMKSQLMGMVDPWVSHPRDVAHLAPTDKVRALQGETVSVNSAKQLITLKLSWKSLGNEEPVQIPAPAFMPGWALQPGRQFRCCAPAKCTLENLRENPWLLRDFRAPPYDYLPTETLEKMVGYRAAQNK